MPALPSPRDLRRHLLLIHSVEMHLISIMVLIKMYFILIEILKNALFLQPLYFESNFEKCREDPKSTVYLLARISLPLLFPAPLF